MQRIEPRTVQPVKTRYTDYAVPALYAGNGIRCLRDLRKLMFCVSGDALPWVLYTLRLITYVYTSLFRTQHLTPSNVKLHDSHCVKI